MISTERACRRTGGTAIERVCWICWVIIHQGIGGNGVVVIVFRLARTYEQTDTNGYCVAKVGGCRCENGFVISKKIRYTI